MQEGYTHILTCLRFMYILRRTALLLQVLLH
jgi:hypothetical protein